MGSLGLCVWVLWAVLMFWVVDLGWGEEHQAFTGGSQIFLVFLHQSLNICGEANLG